MQSFTAESAASTAAIPHPLSSATRSDLTTYPAHRSEYPSQDLQQHRLPSRLKNNHHSKAPFMGSFSFLQIKRFNSTILFKKRNVVSHKTFACFFDFATKSMVKSPLQFYSLQPILLIVIEETYQDHHNQIKNWRNVVLVPLGISKICAKSCSIVTSLAILKF